MIYKCFIQVAGTVERLAAIELRDLGAEIEKEIPRGIYISSSEKTLYRIVYESSLSQRVLYNIAGFECSNEKALYGYANKRINWHSIFSVNDKMNIETNLNESKITHSLYAGQVLKDAICDQFKQTVGSRPDFDSKNADIILNMYIHRDRAQIYIDLGSGSLHKRGYRSVSGAAPLQETLAAAIIKHSGWDGESPMADPMCGSGTLLAEALMHYCRIPAAYLRKKNGLRFLPKFNADLFANVKNEADFKIRELKPGLIRGSDISEENLRICMSNLANLPYGEEVLLKTSDFKKLRDYHNHTIITNPPYGIRLGEGGTIGLLYNELGAWLKAQCTNSNAFILCGNEQLVTELKLRSRWIRKLKNGDLDTVLARLIIK